MKPRKGAARTETTGAPNLTQSPFAALSGLAGSLPLGAPPEPAEPEKEAKARATGKLTLRREKKHRGGKTVVLVTGFSAIPGLDEEAVRNLAAELKRALGCGGGVEEENGERRILVQGDEPARVSAFLTARGFKVGGVTS